MKTSYTQIVFTFFLWLCQPLGTVYAQHIDFYGISYGAGDFNAGAIYKIDENGTVQQATNLLQFEGGQPTGNLCEDTNGVLYGLTSIGGNYNNGILFGWDPEKRTYSKILDFDGVKNGYAYGFLTLTKNGRLCGITQRVNNNLAKFIFEVDPATKQIIKKTDLHKSFIPFGILVEGDDNHIYGSTGDDIFEWNPDVDTIITRHIFDVAENGTGPTGILLNASNGKLYGLTHGGGAYGLGVLFEYDPKTKLFAKKLDFNGTENGSNPVGGLVEKENGKLYGITNDGGPLGFGVIFEWDCGQETFTKKYDFRAGENESFLNNSLIILNDGKLAGIKSKSLSIWDPAKDSLITKTLPFSERNGVTSDGSIIQGKNGKIYGMTTRGGIHSEFDYDSYGVLFQYDLTTDLYSGEFCFTQSFDGKYPVNMVEADNGNFYGTAKRGGRFNLGVLFKYDPSSGMLTKQYDFGHGSETGFLPEALIKATNGKMYGFTTLNWDIGYFCILFEWDPINEKFSKLFSSSGNFTKLVQGDNNKLYVISGSKLFEIDPKTSSIKLKYVFDNSSSNPELICSSREGKIYGIANCCGGRNQILFEWDPEVDQYTKILDFNDSIRFETLIQAPNNKFYGYNSSGIFYEWDAENNIYTIKHKFVVLQDNWRFLKREDLSLGENGKIYGTIFYRKDSGYYIFEWDPMTNDFVNKIDLNWTKHTLFNQLITKVKCNCRDTSACSVLQSPSGKYTWTSSGTYQDTLKSINGCDSIIVVNLTITNVRPRVAKNISVCEGFQVPDFIATSQNIRWYSDAGLSNLLHEGNTFPTGQTLPGTYTYFVTQTLNNCESLPGTVTLTIKPNPPAPYVQDETLCSGYENSNLEATGENIRWYAMSDSLTDSRDGKKYNTVRIGNLIWMADNLDIGIQQAGSLDQTNNQVIEKYCYDDNPANCKQYGGLYHWNELMNYSTSESNQGICPAGWHVPSNSEWIEMETALGMDPSLANSFGFRGTDQGTKLLAGGSSGYNALLAGKRTPAGTFASLDSYCTFWNSSAANRTLSSQFPEIYASNADDKSNGFSLRCVCDDSSVIATGNAFNPGIAKPGIYSFQVSQTVNGCESSVATAVLTVSPVPSSPVTHNITICEGDSVPDLTAQGENIQWYSDTSLSNLIESGNSYTSGQTLPGKYIYYVTQTIAACESDTESVTLTINTLPAINLGKDTTIYSDQDLILGPFTDEYHFLWNDGSENPYLEISGSDLGPGHHKIAVMVSDINRCNNSDTVNINVVPYLDLHYNQNNNPNRLFPNPTNGSFTIDLDKVYSNVDITITELEGRIIQMDNFRNIKEINLKLDTEPGIYLVTISTINDRAIFKIIKK